MRQQIFLLFKNPLKLTRFVGSFYSVINLLGVSWLKTVFYLIQLASDFKFHLFISSQKRKALETSKGVVNSGWLYLPGLVLIYLVIRSIKPKIVVETGVGPGGSTAYILKALRDNRIGKLWSIDLPGEDKRVYPKLGRPGIVHVPDGWEAGWLIPGWLKDRHQLIIGDAKKELPKLLRKIGRVDVFLHDSLHTDKQVMAELEVVFPKMGKGGIIMADDVNNFWSMAFVKFCKSNDINNVVFQERIGIGRLG